MALLHPLDRVVWTALTGRQADVAIVGGGARRFDPAYGVFGALDNRSEASYAGLASLVAAHGDVALLEDRGVAFDAPGLVVTSEDILVQMIAKRPIADAASDVEMIGLTDADAAEMLALARLTKPGPFFERTHQLGAFFGVRVDGRLAAMAGERMQPDGFTEVSGVCTHPDNRGRGYAGALMRRVAGRIAARGETAFLHAFASNRGAIGLYETLGFSIRREVLARRVTAAEKSSAAQAG